MGAHQSDKPAHPRPPGASPPGGCSRPSAVESKAHRCISTSAVHMHGWGGSRVHATSTPHKHTHDNTNSTCVLETAAPQGCVSGLQVTVAVSLCVTDVSPPAWLCTHLPLGLQGCGADHLLHIVRREPQLLLPPVVPPPPVGATWHGSQQPPPTSTGGEPLPRPPTGASDSQPTGMCAPSPHPWIHGCGSGHQAHQPPSCFSTFWMMAFFVNVSSSSLWAL